MIGDHVKDGLHGAQPSLTDLDDNGNLVPAVDFHTLYTNVLPAWLDADDTGLLGGSFPGVSLFTSAAEAPFTGSEQGPLARQSTQWRQGLRPPSTTFGSVTHSVESDRRGGRRRRRTWACGW